MPYDYFCPTVKLRLSSRTCKTCGLYHASVKSLNELMCIIQNLEHQDVEWLDESDSQH
nr:unnamed protein product [Callosobruchus chinensis]CAH7753475.1 unnamed protein product [Callosobruchus chinensis]CAH7763404.1 unnamed protein product [Callosobruchus chinensis]CAH7763774.1 unnamed protein product [Callosobruchus chinensis]